MRSIIRSNRQLSELRASVRRDVVAPGDDDQVIRDFVMAVNEVVAEALSHGASDTSSIDVRWFRRLHPHAELYAEIRRTSGTPTSLLHEGIISCILLHTAERIDVQERIGGSVITIRSRI